MSTPAEKAGSSEGTAAEACIRVRETLQACSSPDRHDPTSRVTSPKAGGCLIQGPIILNPFDFIGTDEVIQEDPLGRMIREPNTTRNRTPVQKDEHRARSPPNAGWVFRKKRPRCHQRRVPGVLDGAREEGQQVTDPGRLEALNFFTCNEGPCRRCAGATVESCQDGRCRDLARANFKRGQRYRRRLGPQGEVQGFSAL